MPKKKTRKKGGQTYLGTHIADEAYERFKAAAKTQGQSIASRLRLVLETLP
jgi:hypothetical protein